MKTHFINTGKSGDNVACPGLVLKLDKEEGKYEPIITWLLKGKNNKSFVNAFLQGKQMSLYSVKDSFSEKIGSISGGKELSLIDTSESELFDGQQVVYANAYKLSNVILVPKQLEEDESKSFIREEISSMIEDKYPIPLEESWKNYFIDLISKSSISELVFIALLPAALRLNNGIFFILVLRAFCSE